MLVPRHVIEATGGASVTESLPGRWLVGAAGGSLVEFSITGTGSPWTVSLQVTNEDGDAVAERFWVRIMVGAAEWDETSGDTITVTSASEDMVVNGQTIDILTLSDGTAEVEITAAANRYVTGSVLGVAVSSGVLTYSVPGTPGEWQFNDQVNSAHLLTAGF